MTLPNGHRRDADNTVAEYNEQENYQGDKETLHRHLNNKTILIGGINPDAQELLDSGTASVIYPRTYTPAQ
ncbi:MAG: hypothetical protein QS721_08980 [Candidatus Endonucleobacter sp. (ex Gigantidas childressi)]|nr:hypothetical protein [Candidatus Endonucleobacter sp. (ex Gigantidas childressi)]